MRCRSLLKAGVLSAVMLTPAMTAQAEITDTDLDVEIVADGLGIPWGMALLPDNSMLVTSRDGRLTHLDLNGGETQIDGTPEVYDENQGGFLDIALAPDFENNGWIYFTYSKPVDGKAATTLARAKMEDNALTEWQDLLVTDSRASGGRHFGSRIVFDNDGHVFFSIGDRGQRDHAQDLSRHNGKILRLSLDGSVPSDNPFVNESDAHVEIWSYGHRNPQGMYYNQDTGMLWAIEHGPRGGDEINLVEAGKNYGWPKASHGKEYSAPIAVGEAKELPGMENPVKVYVPSIAPSGLIQYQGEAFGDWQGLLITGALVKQHLNIVALDDNNEVTDQFRLLKKQARIRNVIESPEGWLYISTDAGHIKRIRPAE